MSTFEIDDQACFHAKVVRAGNEAFGAWCRAGSWCMAHLTDGYVTRDIAVTIAGTHVWCRLRDCGLPGPGLIEEVEGGYQIHQWEHWQRTSEEILRHRALCANRQKNKRAALRAGVAVTQSVTRDKRVSTPKVTPPVTRESSTPDPDPDPDPDTDPDLLSASVSPSAPTTLSAAALHGTPTEPDGGMPEKPKRKRTPKPKTKPAAEPEGYRAVVDAYFVAFAAARRGTKPAFGGREGKAVKTLIETMGSADAACSVIRDAFCDPWLAAHGSILAVAADPSKYLGKGASVQRSPSGHAEAVRQREQLEYEARLANAPPDPLLDAMREIDRETHL